MSNKIQKSNSLAVSKSSKGKLDLTSINLDTLSVALGDLSIPRLFYQLVIFVLDGSGSMSFEGLSGKSKGEEVEQAVKSTLDRLHQSKNKNSFDISLWAYANESVQISNVKPVILFNSKSNLNPCSYIEKNNGTNLSETLDSVKKECQNYLEMYKDKNAQALVVIISDGAIEDYEASLTKCDEIKNINNNSVASVFFESKVWQDNYLVKEISTLKVEMKNFASHDALFTSTLDPEEIRKHMIKSISTVSKID